MSVKKLATANILTMRAKANPNVEAGGPKAAMTRQRILDATARVLAQQGFRTTSLQEIADAAGMKKGSLYFHFSSRDALIGEVLREGVLGSFDMVRQAVEELGADASAKDKLRAAILAHMSAARSLFYYAAAVFRIIDDVPDEIRVHVRDTERAYAKYWTDLIRLAQSDGHLVAIADPRNIRQILFGAMNSLGVMAPSQKRDREVMQTVISLLGLDE